MDAWCEDREEIMSLRARYCRYLDFGQWPELRSLFCDDAELHLAGGSHYPDPDVFVHTMRSHFPGEEQVVHHCAMPELVRLDKNRARGVWALFSLVDHTPGDPVGAGAQRSWSYYAEDYRRVDERWRIASLRLVRLRTERSGLPVERPAGWRSAGAWVEGFLRGEDGPPPC